MFENKPEKNHDNPTIKGGEAKPPTNTLACLFLMMLIMIYSSVMDYGLSI
jgi:hypothetical protein